MPEIIPLKGTDKSVRVGGLGCKCEGWEYDAFKAHTIYFQLRLNYGVCSGKGGLHMYIEV